MTIALPRPPWYAGIMAALALSIALAFAVPYIQVPTLPSAPQGAWVVSAGEQQWVVRLGQQPTAISAPQTSLVETFVAQTEKEQWALALLAQLGNPKPSADIVAFVVAWQAGENTAAQFNPLATTQPYDGDSCFNYLSGRCGVRNYASRETGLNATVETLVNGNYPNIWYALQNNQPALALNDAELATWGTGLANVLANYKPAFQTRASDSQSYVLQGDVGVNVRAALDANGGAIRHFTIQPGQIWSFGRSIAPISAMGYLPIVCGPAGCNAGGGWCDLTAMYVRVADQLALQSSFPAHGGISNPRFPGILLNDDGSGGDLTITNTTNVPITFTVTEADGVLTVAAG